MSQERSFDEMVTIGRVVKPQGRKGELLVHPLSDCPERFPALRRAYVAGPGGGSRAISVTHCWPHKGRFVLKLSGVDSISEAEAYRGLDIRIPEDELPELPDGAYYHHQLLGLRVEEHAGEPVGVVAQVLETGAALYNAMGDVDRATYLHKRALRIYGEVEQSRTPDGQPEAPAMPVETTIEVEGLAPGETPPKAESVAPE